jgi:CO/xanthine dehydrogenase Mo-binding subunit
MHVVVNAGAYEVTSGITTLGNSFATVGDYRIPNVKWDCYGVYTNDPPACAFRGFGINDIIWAIESHMDMLADALGMDPITIRKRNILVEGEPNVIGEITHSIGTEECINKVAKAIDWKKKPIDKGKWKVGKGIAIGNKFSTAPTVNVARIKVTEEGNIEIFHSADSMGQGCNTVLAQIVAEEFGVSINDINVVFSDTLYTPYFAEGSSSSRSTYNLGNALRLACQKAKQDLFTRAAVRLKCLPDNLDIRDKTVFVRSNPLKNIEISDLFFPFRGKNPKVFGGGAVDGEIIASGTYIQDHTREDPETGLLDPLLANRGKRARAFCVHFAKAVEVGVNVETGEVKILRLFTANDIGKAINPKLCEQQAEGGSVMGIGAALYEEMVMLQGSVQNDNLHDYRIPSIRQIPDLNEFKSWFIQSIPHKDGPFGAKGFGEAALVSIEPAIGNAIYDAIGVRITDLPITPERILKALNQA